METTSPSVTESHLQNRIAASPPLALTLDHQQLEQIVAWTRTKGGKKPLLLAGDLNISPADPEYETLLKYFSDMSCFDRTAPITETNASCTDQFEKGVETPSYERCDHLCLFNGSVGRVSAEVSLGSRFTISDHRPLIATVNFNSTSTA